MNSGLSGFYNAPVTKVVVFGSGLCSLLAGSRGFYNTLLLSHEAVILKREYWRIFTSSLVFRSTPEVVFGLYLVYFFRVFERQLGSNKYAVFVLFSTVVSSLIQAASLVILKDVDKQLVLAPGPFGLIFASFVPFFFDIPISTRFTIFNVTLSDKSFVYLAGLQLFLSSWKQSMIPGVSGLLAGFLYRSNILGLRRVKFPEVVSSTAARLFAPILSRSPPPSTGRTSAARAGGSAAARPDVPMSQLGGGIPGGGGMPPPFFAAPARGFMPSAPPMAPLPPPEEAVATLEAMGFDRAAAIRALAQCHNDVTLATNLLVESQVS